MMLCKICGAHLGVPADPTRHNKGCAKLAKIDNKETGSSFDVKDTRITKGRKAKATA